MNIESFRAQIKNAKQQILDERLKAERKAAEIKDRAKQDEMSKEVEKQKVAEATKQEVIRNFTGTNIIETLEGIRDEEILIYTTNERYNSTEIKNFFGRGTGFYNKEKIVEIVPMKILFDTDTVIAEFDHWYDNGGEYRDSDSGSSCIKITKSNDIFSLKYNHGHDFDVSSNDPSDIISGVARIVAAKQLK